MAEVRLRPMSPRKVNAQARRLLHYLELDEHTAELLKYTRPAAFTPEPNNCHLNTWCQTRLVGGAPQHGWVLTQDNEQSFVETIFHTVWRSPEGKLVDVTPRIDLEKRLLFIPDQRRHIVLTEYKGQPAICTFDNVRMFREALLAPLTPITVVLEGDFAQRNRLWPW